MRKPLRVCERLSERAHANTSLGTCELESLRGWMVGNRVDSKTLFADAKDVKKIRRLQMPKWQKEKEKKRNNFSSPFLSKERGFLLWMIFCLFL